MTCCAFFALTLDTHILGPTMDILNIAAPALQFLAAINSTSKRLQDRTKASSIVRDRGLTLVRDYADLRITRMFMPRRMPQATPNRSARTFSGEMARP